MCNSNLLQALQQWLPTWVREECTSHSESMVHIWSFLPRRLLDICGPRWTSSEISTRRCVIRRTPTAPQTPIQRVFPRISSTHTLAQFEGCSTREALPIMHFNYN